MVALNQDSTKKKINPTTTPQGKSNKKLVSAITKEDVNVVEKKKKRKARPGSKVDSSIIEQQKSNKMAVQKIAIKKLARKMAEQHSSERVLFRSNAFKVIHSNVETFIEHILAQAKTISNRCDCETTMAKDISLVLKLNERLPVSIRRTMIGFDHGINESQTPVKLLDTVVDF